MRIHSLVAATALVVSLSAQTQVVLGAAQDNTIYSGDPVTGSNGAGDRFFCGTDLGLLNRRGLIAFDVAAAVPPGSTIVSARLELSVAQTRSTNRACTVHRVTSDWGEAGSVAGSGQGGGGIAMPGDATWDYAFWPTTTWLVAGGGGDFLATASASTVVGFTGRFAWSSAQLTADVQAMLDTPGSNFGWLLRTDETVISTARAFHSREALVAANRPSLTINYLPAASVTSVGAGCTGGGPSPLTLTATGLPQVPNPAFALDVAGGPIGGLMAINLFALQQNPPLPVGGGCEVYGDFATFIIGFTVGGTLPFGIPNNTAFIGIELTTQGVALDFANLTFATSNGLVLRLGT
ncbi:MAG: DNRLRE domain-containing protein [Planctomycetes bacterium]|nr:DNRLRE domain-containing protein [Planctomycetota bacterium]